MRKWTWAFHPTSLITTVSLLICFHLKACLLYLRLRSALLWSTRTSKKPVWKASDPVLPPSHSTPSNHVSCHVSYFTTSMNLLWGLIFLLRPIFPPSPQTTSALLFQPYHFNIKHWLEILKKDVASVSTSHTSYSLPPRCTFRQILESPELIISNPFHIAPSSSSSLPHFKNKIPAVKLSELRFGKTANQELDSDPKHAHSSRVKDHAGNAGLLPLFSQGAPKRKGTCTEQLPTLQAGKAMEKGQRLLRNMPIAHTPSNFLMTTRQRTHIPTSVMLLWTSHTGGTLVYVHAHTHSLDRFMYVHAKLHPVTPR